METSWTRQLAFWVGLLLSLCILDSHVVPRSESTVSLDPGREFVLTVQPLLVLEGDPEIATAVWRTTVLREVELSGALPTHQKGRGFREIEVLAGETSRSTRHSAEVSLSEGSYWAITRAPGYARVVERIEFSKALRLQPKLVPAASLSVRVMVDGEEELSPLSRATVLVGNAEVLAFGAQTDDAGACKFSALPPGANLVRIFAPGYEPYEGMAEGELMVRLRPVSTLRVRVTDGGEPQPGASVFIAGVQLWPARSTTTDELGAIDITGLKPGKYALYALKGSRVSTTTRDVEIRNETGVVEVELRLMPGHHVPVLVQAKGSETPIAGARITWSSSGVGQFSLHARADSEGRATLGPLSEGGGVLTVRAAGFVARVVPVESFEGPGGRVLVELVRAAVVEGRVVDPDGFPVSGATVEVVGTDLFGMPVSVTFRSEAIADTHFDWSLEHGNVLLPAGELGVMLGPVPPIPLGEVQQSGGQRLTTDEKGYFHAEGVPPGEVVVLARHPEYMDGRSEVLSLSPGVRRKTEIVLGRGQVLRGRVLDHAGFPVSHARVQVTARKFDRRVTAETDGTFLLSAAPETVSISVSMIEQPLRTIFSREVLKSERTEEVQIELPEPRREVLVRVKDKKGEPVELSQVTLISLDKQVPFKQTRFTHEDGSVEFEEARGLQVKVQVKAPGFVEVERTLSLKEENEISLEPSITAEGRITGVRGRLPASGAEVRFKAGALVRRAVCDEFGEYRVTGLPPGRGELWATHPEYGSGRQAVMVPSEGGDRVAELPALDLTPALKISGRVEDAQGRPLAGALLSATRLSPYLSSTIGAEILGETDARGEFSVSVERTAGLHLYAALPARAFGWSKVISAGERDEVEGVVVLVDQKDQAEPDAMGSILIGLSGPVSPRVYVVAEGSQAARAGIQVDDDLVEIDGQIPEDMLDARILLSGLVGSDLRLVVRRGGRRLELIVPREAFLR